MKDWNEFHERWDNMLRNHVLPYMKTATHEERKTVNYLLSDLKSSLKWSRFDDCVNIFNRLKSIV